MGSKNYNFKTNIGCILYFMASLLISIIMLNMVISVVSDSYDRIQMSKKEEDMKSKADLLLEYSQLLRLFLSNNDEVGHIYVMRQKVDEDAASAGWEGKIKVTHNLITHAEEKVIDAVKTVK